MFRLFAKNRTQPIVAILFVAIVIFATFTPVGANAQSLSFFPWLGEKVISGTMYAIATLLMGLSSLLLIISGWVFDTIVDVTVMKMSSTIGNTTDGIGVSITEAWATVRDIANMVFIFVLLYTAFRTMFMSEYSNVGKSILNIVIIAILINFSLFFTKVVIDASNIVSDGFYRAITSTNEYSLDDNFEEVPFMKGKSKDFKGISGGYMRLLGLQTWYSADILTGKGFGALEALTIGILSSIFFFVAAIVLFMAAIMFAARFIILIFLMILSPFAFIAYIIPGSSGKFSEWWQSLLNQAFFAPIFFALTWIVFKVGSSFIKVSKNAGWSEVRWADLPSDPQGATGLVINFIILIGLSIAALVISKQMASKGATAGAFGALTAAGGAVAFGGAAIVGRNTLGRTAKWIGENKRDTWSQSSIGRAGLWVAGKTSTGSFDSRGLAGTGVGKALGGDKTFSGFGKAGGEGGFSKAVEEKAKAKAEYAKKVYGQTVQEKDKEILSNDATIAYEKSRVAEANKIKGERTQIEQRLNAEKNAATKTLTTAREDLAIATETGVSGEEMKQIQDRVRLAQEDLRKKTEAHLIATNKLKAEIEDSEYTEETRELGRIATERKEEWEKVKGKGAERQKEYARRLTSFPFGIGAGGKAAARSVREIAEGKEKKDMKKLLKEIQKAAGVEEEAKPEEPKTT